MGQPVVGPAGSRVCWFPGAASLRAGPPWGRVAALGGGGGVRLERTLSYFGELVSAVDLLRPECRLSSRDDVQEEPVVPGVAAGAAPKPAPSNRPGFDVPEVVESKRGVFASPTFGERKTWRSPLPEVQDLAALQRRTNQLLGRLLSSFETESPRRRLDMSSLMADEFTRGLR